MAKSSAKRFFEVLRSPSVTPRWPGFRFRAKEFGLEEDFFVQPTDRPLYLDRLPKEMEEDARIRVSEVDADIVKRNQATPVSVPKQVPCVGEPEKKSHAKSPDELS